MKILVTMKATEEHINQLSSVSQDVEIFHATDKEEIKIQITDADAVFGVTVSPEELKAAGKLKWIQSLSAGLEIYLTPELIESDIIFTNGSGLHAVQLSEHAFAFMLSLARGLNLYIRNQLQRKWQNTAVSQLEGATVGIVGLGGSGTEVARRARTFDMTVLAIDILKRRKPDFVDELWGLERLDDLLDQSDFVVLTAPHTDRTHHIIDRQALKRMKPTAYLINVARGKLIDEKALVEALKDKEIAGAGLDVFEEEPLPEDSELWAFENVIISTHAAGHAPSRPQKIVDLFCENLKRYLSGEPLLNLVDKKAGFPEQPLIKS